MNEVLIRSTKTELLPSFFCYVRDFVFERCALVFMPFSRENKYLRLLAERIIKYR